MLMFPMPPTTGLPRKANRRRTTRLPSPGKSGGAWSRLVDWTTNPWGTGAVAFVTTAAFLMPSRSTELIIDGIAQLTVGRF